jgi:hypothetical protein
MDKILQTKRMELAISGSVENIGEWLLRWKPRVGIEIIDRQEHHKGVHVVFSYTAKGANADDIRKARPSLFADVTFMVAGDFPPVPA